MKKTTAEIFYQFYDSEKFDEAISFYKENETVLQSGDIKKFYALAYFKKGDYNTASGIFKELLHEQKSLDTYFNLSVNQILSGSIEEGLATYYSLINFSKENEINFLEYKIHITNALIEMKQAGIARTMIEELSVEMQPYQNADVHFLYVSNLPVYADFLHCANRFFNILSREDAKTEIYKLSGKLNADNYNILNKYAKDILGESLPLYHSPEKINQQPQLFETNVQTVLKVLLLITIIVLLIWRCKRLL